jgi:hypothetical protein
MPRPDAVRTFSSSLKARCARRAPAAADPQTAPRAEGTGRPRRSCPPAWLGGRARGDPPLAGRRPPLKALRATAATAHAASPARPPRPGPRRPPPVLAARTPEEVASSRRPSLEPRKITLKGALRASHAMAQGATLDRHLPRITPAPTGRMAPARTLPAGGPQGRSGRPGSYSL